MSETENVSSDRDNTYILVPGVLHIPIIRLPSPFIFIPSQTNTERGRKKNDGWGPESNGSYPKQCRCCDLVRFDFLQLLLHRPVSPVRRNSYFIVLKAGKRRWFDATQPLNRQTLKFVCLQWKTEASSSPPDTLQFSEVG